MNVALLETIDRKRKELDALLPMSPENEARLERKFRLEFNYNSNHIEGNTLTYGETKLLLISGETIGKHPYRDLQEMKASDLALKITKDLAADKEHPLTESAIRYLNEILLAEPYWKEAKTADGQPTRIKVIPGNYKQHANGVPLENGEEISFVSPRETLIKMPELISWFREEEEKKELPLVVLAATLHFRFVSIHPFDDGNGRISRLLMNYVFYKNGLPPVIIKSDDKKNYLRSLREADAGNLDAFIDYIAEQLIWSLDLSIRCAKGEEIEEAEDWKKQLKVLSAGLNDKEKTIVQKDLGTVKNIIDNVCEPLKNFISSELQDIKELFQSFYSTLFTPVITTHGTANVTRDIAHWANNNAFIEIQLEFFDFKRNGINSFSIRSTIQFDFERYRYLIRINNSQKTLLTKAYNEVLSEEERRTIVNKIGKEIIGEIDYKLKQA